MRSVLAPPPDERPMPAPAPAPATPVAIGPSIPAPTPTPAVNQPLADLITELEADERPLAVRPRAPSAQRFRQSGTVTGRGLGASRRPQAAAPTPAPTPAASASTRIRREATEVESAPEAAAEGTGSGSDWRSREIPVDDSQLVDWKTDAGVNAITGDDDFGDLGGRKR
jgi:hypothetical protein